MKKSRRAVEDDEEETPRKKPLSTKDELPKLLARHPSTGKMIEVDYSNDVRITDPEKNLREHSSRFSWYLALRDTAADDLRDAQYNEYCVEEELYLEYRDAMNGEGGKPPTEGAIKTAVKANTKMREAYVARNEAESRYKKAESVIASMIERRWNLQSLVKLKAAEMGSGLGDA